METDRGSAGNVPFPEFWTNATPQPANQQRNRHSIVVIHKFEAIIGELSFFASNTFAASTREFG